MNLRRVDGCDWGKFNSAAKANNHLRCCLHCAGDWEEYEVTADGMWLVRTQVRLFRRKQDSISLSGDKVTITRTGADRVGFGTHGTWEMEAPGAAVSGTEQSLCIGKAEMVLLVTILLQNAGGAIRQRIAAILAAQLTVEVLNVTM